MKGLFNNIYTVHYYQREYSWQEKQNMQNDMEYRFIPKKCPIIKQ